VLYRLRYVDTARISKRLQTRCYVYTITKDISTLYSDITKVNSNPDLLVKGFLRANLNFNTALYGLQCAIKLGQHSVSHFFEPFATILLNGRLLNFPARSQYLECSFFIGTHECRIPNNIGKHNRS
jgi:hypothetical protein